MRSRDFDSRERLTQPDAPAEGGPMSDAMWYLTGLMCGIWALCAAIREIYKDRIWRVIGWGIIGGLLISQSIAKLLGVL